MFDGHDLYLVALSVAIAILGGYNGFALAARIRRRSDANDRVLLAGAAAFLAFGIWTMHFIGMLAAPLPAGTAYLVLPTIVSFLICVLVVGVSLFLVSIGAPSRRRLASAAALLGVGISSMHYVGMHGLSGPFEMRHDPLFVVLSILIAIGAAYGGLRAFLAEQHGVQLVLSAVAFGIAVSGMHYTAMLGVHLAPAGLGAGHHDMGGLAASQQILALVVALLCFVIAAGFLLSLVPDRHQRVAAVAGAPAVHAGDAGPDPAIADEGGAAELAVDRPKAAPAPLGGLPLGGLGQPRSAPVLRLPVTGADGMHFIEAAEVRSIRADAHYTHIHDGTRERLCPWSISEAEAQLDPEVFLRVHRSYIVAIRHVTFVRREGDGAVLELDGIEPHRIPVSRARIAEVRARLGLVRRPTPSYRAEVSQRC
jgi:NO-binding membrane sensor protein with MHYT domain